MSILLACPSCCMPPTLAGGSSTPCASTSGRSSSASFSSLSLPFQGRRGCTSRRSPRFCTADSGVSPEASSQKSSGELRTCRTCKQKFNSSENNPRACRFHTAHFGGETKRKFESVYSGGTMDTVGGGEIIQYWHCCGSSDPFDAGCEAAPHVTYDD